MRNEKGALHLEVLSAMPGRIRFQLEKPIKSDVPFLGIKGVTRCRYNPRIGTLLCEYDQLTATEEQLLVKIGAVYAGLVGTALLHIKHSEEEGFSMAPSGLSGAVLHCAGRIADADGLDANAVYALAFSRRDAGGGGRARLSGTARARQF